MVVVDHFRSGSAVAMETPDFAAATAME